MRATDRTALAVILSVFLASFTISPLTTDSSYLGISWVVIVLIGVVSLVMRRLRLGAGTIVIAQLLILVAALLVFSTMLPASGLSWYGHVFHQFAAGAEHMRTQGSPMEPNDGVKFIFVTAIGVIMVMTDLLAAGLRRPVWAIAPPATLFLVPAIGIGADTGVLSFLLIAIGYLAILIAEGLNSTARWTRGLSRDTAEGMGTAMPVVWRAATYIALPAIALTVAMAVITPTPQLSGFGFGNGPGGDGPLQLTDPTIDLRRNLNQPTDQTVITYTTDQPGGVYLRMATLPRFSGAGWALAPMRIDQDSNLPPIPGVGTEPSTIRKTEIRVGNFSAEYLPAPYAPRRLDASGNWGTDPNSLVIIGTRDSDNIRNLTYTVESADIAPSSAELLGAVSGTPLDSALTSVIPSDLPDSLVNLALEITKDHRTPAEKASAIQAYLRSSRFTYSTEPQPGSGYETLEDFLLNDRTGYCEQFAGAMAMMARVANIPSRVAVGFLPGTAVADNTYEVSIRQMHAWPELYFADFGWVRYEPTPATVTGVAPPWTLPGETGTGADPSIEPSASASTPTGSVAPNESEAPSEAPVTNTTDSTFPWARTVGWSLGGLAGLLILAAPATIRLRRRSVRLSGDGEPQQRVEAAWSEIRDTVVDLGGSWPAGSPRTIGAEVGDHLDSAESQAMGQVATLVERSRYSESFDDAKAVGELPTMTTAIRAGLAQPMTRTRRMLAVLAPRSLFRRRPRD